MTAPTWTDLEARFRALLPAMKWYRLDYQWGSAGEHWGLRGGVSNASTSEFETLATIAGDLLLSLPPSAVAPEALAEPKAKYRWYVALWHHMTPQVPDGMMHEKRGDEIVGRIFTGAINEPVHDSATLCLQFSTIGEEGKSQAPTKTGSDVFIVHGHDEANLVRLQNLIEKRFKLHPVILRLKAGKGRALIEKFEDEAERCAYAFVLLTPDDQIAAPDGQYTQARPNVVFELGWFYGRLHRSRVTILVKEGTKLHSDLDGISRIEFVESVKEKLSEIERELQAAGLISGNGSVEGKDRELPEPSLDEAEIRARLYDAGSSHRVELSNKSAVTASDVDIEFLDQDEDSLLPQGERKDKLPIPKLEPGESVTLMVALAKQRWPPFKIVLSWKDPAGTTRRREDILYAP